MKQYLNFTQNKISYNFKHSFLLVFERIETVLFSFLCIILLVIARTNDSWTKSLSFGIVSVSAPVVKIVYFPFNTIIDLSLNFNDLVAAKKENKVLKEELAHLRDFYIKSLDINNENKELREILNFVSAKSSTYKSARIISKSHPSFSQRVFVEGGKNLEIKEGSVVVGNKGVIGRIVEVGDTKSRLILLNDAGSRIPVITSKSRARGILAGNNSDSLEILYLPKGREIPVNDWVFTSGDGDTLPPGLLVGVVKKSENGKVTIQMVEDVNEEDIVTIIDY